MSPLSAMNLHIVREIQPAQQPRLLREMRRSTAATACGACHLVCRVACLWLVACGWAGPVWGQSKVTFDPPAGQLKIQLQGGTSIAFPPATNPQGGDVLYPPQPSPFVMLGHGGGADQVVLWNVVSNQQAGKLRLPADHQEHLSLSPDGKHLAQAVFSAKAGSWVVNVWSFASESIAREIPIPAKGAFDFLHVTWAGPHRLVSVLQNEQKQKRIVVVDAVSGIVSVTLADGGLFKDRRSFAISPGGRYAALLDEPGNHIRLADLSTGSRVHSYALPRLTVPPGTTLSCTGVSFAPDGTEVGALYGGGAVWSLLSWNLQTAKLEVNIPLPGTDMRQLLPGSEAYRGPTLEWLPDASAWLLLGQGVIDRETGTLAWILRSPAGDSGSPRRLLDNDHLLVVNPTPGARKLEVVTLPWKEIDGSLALLKDSAALAFQLGQPLKLQLDINDTNAPVNPGSNRERERNELRQIMQTALATKLAALGVTVNEQAPTVLAVQVRAEASGVITMKRSPGTGTKPATGTGNPGTVKNPTKPGTDPVRPGTGAPGGAGPIVIPVPPQNIPKDNRPPQRLFSSGIVVSPQGHILTSAQGVDQAASVEVRLGTTKYTAQGVAKDAHLNLALLKITGSNLPVLPWADSGMLAGGEEVRAVGFMAAPGDKDLALKVNRGTLKEVIMRGEAKLFVTDIAGLRPTYSGGPLCNDRGEVVAIQLQRPGNNNDPAGLMFGVAVNDIKKLLADNNLTIPAPSAEATAKPDITTFTKGAASAVCLVTAVLPQASELPADMIRTTKFTIEAQLKQAGIDQPLWSDQAVIDPFASLTPTGTNLEVFVNLTKGQFLTKVQGLKLPLYVLKDKTLVTLPGSSDVLAGKASPKSN